MARQLGGRHIIALDLPGHGNSELPPSWEPDALARELVTAVRRRWPGEHIWVGHSWGGKLAVAAAALDSAAARGIILVDAVPASEFRLPDPAQTANELFAGELDPWPNLDSALAAARTLPQYSPWTPDVELAFRRGVRVQSDGRVVPHLSRSKATTILSSMSMDLSGAAAAIQAPVLILSAPEGWFDEEQQNLFPTATFVRLNGNHWLQISNVSGVATIVLGWLRTHAL
jgi:pimeloyl-ACP methyl ester carboxylesterase